MNGCCSQFEWCCLTACKILPKETFHKAPPTTSHALGQQKKFTRMRAHILRMDTTCCGRPFENESTLGLGAACSCALIANDNPRRATQAHVLRLHTAFCCVLPLAIASMPGRFVPGNTHLFHLTVALPQIASVLTAMGFAQLCTQCARQAKPRKHRQAARNSRCRHCAGAEHPLQTSATAQCAATPTADPQHAARKWQATLL